MGTNDKSILSTIKKPLGLADDYTPFDEEIIIHINTVLSELFEQLGIGTQNFSITDATAKWSDFLGIDDEAYNAAKSYMYLRIKLLFDPPQIGFVLTAMKEQIEKHEWQLSAIRENRLWAAQQAAEASVDGEVVLDAGSF